MLIKAREESNLLKVLRIVNKRMEVSLQEQKYFLNQEKGFEGEVQFDGWTEQIQSECLIVNGLLLEVNNTTFQIDSLVIFQDVVYHFEVKNYEGAYFYESENLFTLSKKEVKNPFDQLKRGQSLLRQLFQQISMNFPIESYVVFINPEFILFQTPLNIPVLFQAQLPNFIKKLNNKSSTINDRHKRIAEKLVSLHQTESSFKNVPKYEFSSLKKGLTCGKCGSFSMFVNGKMIDCGECGFKEKVEKAVMRAVGEYEVLFPERAITTNEIYEWCKVVECRKTITRILGKNFSIKGKHQWSVYERVIEKTEN